MQRYGGKLRSNKYSSSLNISGPLLTLKYYINQKALFIIADLNYKRKLQTKSYHNVTFTR